MKTTVYLILGCVLAGLMATGEQTTKPIYSFVPRGPLKEEKHLGDYIVRTYARLDAGSFEIIHKGVRVYAAHGYSFRIGSIYEKDKTNSLVSIGSDITGDGKPDLLVSEWTGGAHSSYLFNLFEIGSQFRYIQTIDSAHSDNVDFENLDSDPALEFPMYDWTFAYWRCSFAASPAPKVILKYNGNKYEIAGDLMRKPGLPYAKLVQMSCKIKKDEEWKYNRQPSDLWEVMLDLIYTGNMDQAWVFFDLSWPSGIEGKEDFIKDFKEQLKHSPFWKDVQILNKKKK